MFQRILGFAVISSAFLACANGIIADERDGGPAHQDASKVNDGSTSIQDSSPPVKDSSTPIQDGSTCNFTVCGTLCVDTTQDDQNCGQCNNACPSGASCTNSKCTCTSGETLCTNACYDLTSDMNNCGKCGNACTGTQTCMSSTCQSTSTAPPQGKCSHDLCADSLGPLTPGCDTTGCVNNVCTQDSFCCDTDWDSICVSEVADYCPPYTCP
jgi:hypothetical protein